MDANRFPIFSKRFRELRGSRTQAEFADDIGVSRPTVGYYENGTRIPDALTLRQIAEKSGVTTDYLVGLTDAKKFETHDIGAYARLDDEAIQMLRYVTKSFNSRIAINEILKDYKILTKLINYLCSFLEDERKNSRFQDVPLERHLEDNYADANLVRLIEWLPLWRQNIVEKLIYDEGLLDEMLLHYVANLADEAECYFYENGNEEIEECADDWEKEHEAALVDNDYKIFINSSVTEDKKRELEWKEHLKHIAIHEVLNEIERRNNE